MKKAVMYGAGNIGRGFIGERFFKSGYETVFIDINETVVDKLNNDKKYPLYITNGDNYNETYVENVRAVNGKVIENVAAEIASADIMATAVGVNVLPYIAAPIAAGIVKRFESGAAPLNIIICENKIECDKYLRQIISEKISDSTVLDYFNKSIGLVEASIGRMVPAAPKYITEKNPLSVCVEPYCELPVDRLAFVGEIPAIDNMIPCEPFEMYIRRKLFMHNMSHAVTAYLGYLKGYTYIWEAIADSEIKSAARAALSDSASALAAEYGVDAKIFEEFSDDLINRFGNKLLGDTVARVGKDTIRKLSENDRLTGAYKLAEKHGIKSEPIARAIAAAFKFAPEGDKESAEVAAYAKANDIKSALEKYCSITNADDIDFISSFSN